MKTNIFVLPILLTGLFACDTLITEISPEDLPETTSKLVVQSFISPQATRINVVVTESIPLFGESGSSTSVIKNAIVKMSGGGKEVTLLYDSTSQLYTIEKMKFPIVASETYKLSVSDGKRSVTSICTVPTNQVTIKSYVIDTAYLSRRNGPDTALTVKMIWQDIPGESNYYRVRANMDIEYSILEGTNPDNFEEKRVRNRFSIRWDDNSGRSDFQNDVNLDGTSFTSPLGRGFLPSSLLYTSSDGTKYYAKQKPKLIAMVMEVNNTEKSYYEYHQSLRLNERTDNPFAEPVLVFNNILGGLGCFAAYNNKQLIYNP
ncbi:DUF4249 domain-containing protein [Dyadobacter sp. LHD-138]|uniref:DUF4249 domain-containing protein n=1 Tax=Dyadobacter sp. LHD-138 TaxID=3071413 RepID=UPI0027E10DBB|nr:DUF4249 domain-containing protein [Dyadobacter sp. LHD-138]MDQ6478426.1 DUF4249 domain-containing protein [Dyadobacter sp. LHD-138]